MWWRAPIAAILGSTGEIPISTGMRDLLLCRSWILTCRFGSLWICAPFSSLAGEHATGELFRVSERTGRVLQHWPLPRMTRALLAVDDDGLWIAPSIDSGGPNDLYHVPPGMRSPTGVLEIGTRTNPDLAGWGLGR